MPRTFQKMNKVLADRIIARLRAKEIQKQREESFTCLALVLQVNGFPGAVDYVDIDKRGKNRILPSAVCFAQNSEQGLETLKKMRELAWDNKGGYHFRIAKVKVVVQEQESLKEMYEAVDALNKRRRAEKD